MNETVNVEFQASTEALETALQNLEDRAQRFGSVLTSALKGAVISGKSLEDTLRQIGLSLAGMALDAGLKPLQTILGNAFSSLVGSILPFSHGGLTGGIQAFAEGGIVASPTYFGMGNKTGLMGEAGAEAILPLQRGADGRLGVAVNSGSTRQPAVNVTIVTQDANSFRKSEAQVSAAVARAVNRGSRYL